MKLKQHIEIGKLVYKQIKAYEVEPNRNKIKKIPFLLGTIAPDLNCVYPAHRLSTTEKRFYKRLKISASTEIATLKSFTLGVITHYICDYFCYAHNNESLGAKHKKYETNLWNYYIAHLDELESTPSRIRREWKINKEKSINNSFTDNELSIEEQCNIILEQIKLMNKEYKENTVVDRRKNWEQFESQLKYDLQYIIFMASHIDMLVIEPFRCIVLDA